MNEKITPGPWFIKPREAILSPYVGSISTTRITILDTKDGQYQRKHVIAQVANGNGRGDANAALIAAAPEMYDILKHYFDLIQRADYGDILAEQKIFEDIVYIEEVLMKARGEE
ncbi:hypothetical protein [uncultured Victivallis sp.]|uniref:hypothetical protein n=1 Tax=uncultured Victivallis sp. TaxID=354118 RepID=UPI0025EE0FD1|nr:hypothetical protein [uncultured Victivallis sp.]